MNGLQLRGGVQQQRVDLPAAQQPRGAHSQPIRQPYRTLQDPGGPHQQVHVPAALIVIGARAEQQHFAVGAQDVGKLCFEGKTLFGRQARRKSV